MRYRIRPTNSTGAPLPLAKGEPKPQTYPTLLEALRALRDQRTTPAPSPNIRANALVVQYRLAPNLQWHTMTPDEVNRYANDYRIQQWQPLPTNSTNGAR